MMAFRELPSACGPVEPQALLGNSVAMTLARLELEQLARRSRASVLILGERGTGRRHCARLLHQSTYSEGQSFELSHALQLPELEARLSALRTLGSGQSAGLTVHVPELATAVEDIQRCVARLLAEQRLQLRLVAWTASAPPWATSAERRLLEPACRFAFALRLPPLRERLEDIGMLAQQFAQRAASGSGHAPIHFAPSAVARMQQYSWPGNLHELAAFVRSVSVEKGPALRHPTRFGV